MDSAWDKKVWDDSWVERSTTDAMKSKLGEEGEHELLSSSMLGLKRCATVGGEKPGKRRKLLKYPVLE